MALNISEFSPTSGRIIKEDGSIVNIVDLLQGIQTTGIVTSSGLKSIGTITRPANTPTYTAGDVFGTTVASNIVFSNISSVAGVPLCIGTAILMFNLASVPVSMGTWTLHLFDEAPTPIADDTAWTLSGNESKWLGRIDFFVPTDVGDVIADQRSIQHVINLKAGSQVIYGQLVTNGNLVGASGTTATVYLGTT